MTTTTQVPTDAELQAALLEANQRLTDVRAQVFEGTASAEDLDKAERDVRFARTRIDAAAEARNRRRQIQNERRIPEIIGELAELDPAIQAQAKRAEKITELVKEYHAESLAILGEVNGARGELLSIRDSDSTRSLLKSAGVRVTASGAGVTVAGKMYASPMAQRLLTDLQVEVSRPVRKAVAKRPERKGA